MVLRVVLLVVLLGVAEQTPAAIGNPEAVSTNDCHISRSLNRSTTTPSVASGINYTIWQYFEVCVVHIQSGSVTWKRIPYPLSETYYFNLTEDNCTMIHTAFTILNTSVAPDEGQYTVSIELSNGCVNHSVFHLTIPDCDENDTPEPSTGNMSVVLAEPQDNKTWCVPPVIFHGFNDKLYSTINWLLEGVDLCSHHRDKYTCTNETFGQCTLTSHFCILNYSHADSHSYVTMATPVSKAPPGRSTTVDLKVLQLPTITGHKSYHTHMWPASLLYDLANYLASYVTITCKKHGHNHPCHLESDNTRAKVTLDIPLYEAGDYEVCVNFSEEVDTQGTTFQAQCQQTKILTVFLGTETAFAVLLGIAAILSIAVCFYKCKWPSKKRTCYYSKRRDTTDDAEGSDRAPLLDPESDDDIERDAPENSSHRTNQRQRLSTLPNRPRRSRISPSPDPQRYIHPVYGVIPKVCIIYAHNPGEYTRIEPVYSRKILQNGSEILKHEVEQKKRIRQHERSVYMFATFLQHSGVAVAYDQLLYDSSVSNRKMWFEKQIKDSDYIILIITRSFDKFLGGSKLPDDEYMFKGNYLYNIIDHPGDLNFLPVFLDEKKNIDLLPPALKHTPSCEIQYPFDVQSQSRQDDLVKLYRLLTKQASQDVAQQPPRIVQLPEDGVNPGGVVVEDRPVSDADILMLSQNPPFSEHWRLIATNLDVTNTKDCESRGKGDQDEICYQMLTAWRNSAEPDQAMLKHLAEAARAVDERLFKVVHERTCTRS